MKAYDVYLDGKEIDTVFYGDNSTADEVKQGLINHDGYSSDIVVTENADKPSDIEVTKKRITHINALRLATGLQAVLLQMLKDHPDKEAKLSVPWFENLICERKSVSLKEAAKVTEAVINTGILRWEIFGNYFVL